MTNTSAKAGCQVPAYHLDIPPRRHSDAVRYEVWVLWLVGLSASSIGRVVLLNKSMVLGIIDRSDYRNRSAMTDQQRRQLLRELKAVRFEDGEPLDGGLLDNIDWEIQPLTSNKIRPSRKARES